MDMLLTFADAWLTLRQLFLTAWYSDWGSVALKFFPFVLLFELPLQIVVMLGAVRRYLEGGRIASQALPFTPKVSCIITCYSEGADVQLILTGFVGFIGEPVAIRRELALAFHCLRPLELDWLPVAGFVERVRQVPNIALAFGVSLRIDQVAPIA